MKMFELREKSPFTIYAGDKVVKSGVKFRSELFEREELLLDPVSVANLVMTHRLPQDPIQRAMKISKLVNVHPDLALMAVDFSMSILRRSGKNTGMTYDMVVPSKFLRVLG